MPGSTTRTSGARPKVRGAPAVHRMVAPVRPEKPLNPIDAAPTDAEGPAMKFRVERDALADAVAWTAKSLPSRPSVPVLAGVLLRVSDGTLQVSGFDYEVSSQVGVEVHADADGAALVSGRLLAEITKALP